MKLLKQFLFLMALSSGWSSLAGANLMAMPSFVNFGVVDIGTFSYHPPQSVTIYNQGDEAVSMSFSNSCSFMDFNFQAYTCSHVEKNSSCTVSISFSPSHNGSFSCSVNVIDSASQLTNIYISGYATGGAY